MSRILSPQPDTVWYEELQTVAYYSEADVETAILEHVSELFPAHFVLPFKKDVTHKTTKEVRRPDLAIIRKNLSDWGIVEVELEKHNIAHVLAQTRVFAAGDYNASEIAEYVQGQLKKHCLREISLPRLKKLIGAQPPTIMVIADTHNDGWEKELAKEGVKHCVFEIYKNNTGDYLYRAAGSYPLTPVKTAHCRHAGIQNTWEVVGAGFEFRKVSAQNGIPIYFEDRATQWGIFKEGGRKYIRFLGKISPLIPTNTYTLILDRGSRYFFKRS